ncbi:MAG: hypothetical protein J6X44_00585 [Thermoguttaceae bacterium]|nr:hypothetical protein [Thermoguttaceae bacterium]
MRRRFAVNDLNLSLLNRNQNRDEVFSRVPTDDCLRLLAVVEELIFYLRLKNETGYSDARLQNSALPDMDEETAEECRVEVVDVLKGRYRSLSPLGKCSIDDALGYLPIPLTKALANRQFLQGVPTPLPTTRDGFARFYVGWFNESGDDDVDMSARFVGPNHKARLLNWERKRQSFACACFSGEVRKRRGYCAEFVDVDLTKARRHFDYLIVEASVLAEKSFSDMKTTFGFEKRDRLEPDDKWTPESVVDQTRVVSKLPAAIVAIVDLKKTQCFLCDAPHDAIPFHSGNYKAIKASIERLTQPPKCSLRDLLTWHVDGRGELVPWNEFYRADRFFSLENFYKTDEGSKWILDEERE